MKKLRLFSTKIENFTYDGIAIVSALSFIGNVARVKRSTVVGTVLGQSHDCPLNPML